MQIQLNTPQWNMYLIAVSIFGALELNAQSVEDITGNWRATKGDYKGSLEIQKDGSVRFPYRNDKEKGTMTGTVEWETDNGSFLFDLYDETSGKVVIMGCSLETVNNKKGRAKGRERLDCPTQEFIR